MAINYTRLGQRLGKIAGALNEVNTYRGTTLAGRVTTIAGQYTSVNPSLAQDIYTSRDAAESSFASWLGYLSTLASAIIVAEVENDRPQGPNLRDNLIELERQMRADTATFKASRCDITQATVSATGDTVWVANGSDGKAVPRDFLIPDVYVIRVTSDSSTGATRWQETLSCVGKPATQNQTDDDYPTGAGVSTSLTIRDPATANGSIVTDGTFANWPTTGSTNTPSFWTLRSGTVNTTNSLKVADDARDGASGFSLKLISTGALVRVYQQVTVTPNTAYAVHFRLRPKVDSGDHPAVTVRLVDSTGTALTDAAGNACKVTSAAYGDLNADAWTNPVKGVIFTPTVLPALGTYLEIVMHDPAGVTTAPDATDEFQIDHIWMGLPDALYTNGPEVAFFSGLTEAVRGDSYTLTLALSSGAIGDSLLRALDRLLSLRTIDGVSLPSTTGTPTIPDSVVS